MSLSRPENSPYSPPNGLKRKSRLSHGPGFFVAENEHCGGSKGLPLPGQRPAVDTAQRVATTGKLAILIDSVWFPFSPPHQRPEISLMLYGDAGLT